MAAAGHYNPFAYNQRDARKRQVDQEADRLFDDAAVRKIYETLPRSSLTANKDQFARTIRDWAKTYLWLRDLDDAVPTAALTKDVRKIRDAASKFCSAYEKITSATGAIIDPERIVRDFLRDEAAGLDVTKREDVTFRPTSIETIISSVHWLKDWCEDILSEKGAKRARGGQTKRGRRIAALALATIYFETSGERPTRRVNPDTGKAYGPFRDFCIAAFTPIEGAKAGVGIDKLIAKIFMS